MELLSKYQKFRILVDSRSNKVMSVVYYAVIGIVFCFCAYLTDVQNRGVNALYLFNLILSLIIIYRTRNNTAVYIISIFMSMYMVFLYPYFFDGTVFTFRRQFFEEKYIDKMLFIHGLFQYVLFCTIKPSKETSYLYEMLHIEENPLKFWLSYAIVLSITLFAQTGDNILEAGGYSAIMKGQNKTNYVNIAEYILIFIIICFRYADTSFRKWLLLITIIFFCIKCLLYGGRITVIQVSVCVFLLFFPNLLTKRKILVNILLMLGILAMLAIGTLRDAIGYMGEMTTEQLFRMYNTDSPVYITNQGDVFHASMRIVGMIEEGILDTFTRIASFLLLFVRLGVPQKYLPEYSDLSSYLNAVYLTGGGGLISVFFYAWLSFPGVILGGWLVGKLFNASLHHQLKEYQAVFIILFLSTFPRWIAYYPITMLKLTTIGLVMFLLFQIDKYRFKIKI